MREGRQTPEQVIDVIEVNQVSVAVSEPTSDARKPRQQSDTKEGVSDHESDA